MSRSSSPTPEPEKETAQPASRDRWRRLRLARRISQGIFLLIFFWLIGATMAQSGAAVDISASEQLDYPVELFLNFDPYAGALVLLSTGSIPGAMILGLIVLISGLIFGRGFCSWVCPMGTLNHLVGEIRPGLRGKRRLDANAPRRYQKIKYIILVGSLAAALFGSAMGGWFDPICLVTRGISLTFIPIVEWFFLGAMSLVVGTNIDGLRQGADLFHDIAGQAILQNGGTLVEGGIVLSAVFVFVLAANRFIPRFWCRGICPLGALLGLAGRFGLLVLKKNASTCTRCNKCQLSCQGAASPKPGDVWQRAECDLCMNCVATCPEAGTLDFALFGHKSNEQSAPDLNRRQVMTGAVAGAALVPAIRTGTLNEPNGRPNPNCIRPPGAQEEKDFLARCIRCGQCIKICPNNALHPSITEAGVEGLWTPVLIPRIGYCESTCTLCTSVCPTGAIRHVTQRRKTEPGPDQIRLGTAVINRGRCLPWGTNTPCIVCEEFCPVSPKAILVEEETVEIDGQSRRLLKPFVRPDRCIGCGACEHVCPVHDQAAIRVSSVGESRSSTNVLLQRRATEKDGQS